MRKHAGYVDISEKMSKKSLTELVRFQTVNFINKTERCTLSFFEAS